jgi:hypothetical protein
MAMTRKQMVRATVAAGFAAMTATAVMASEGEGASVREQADATIQAIAEATAKQRDEAVTMASDALESIDAAIERQAMRLEREWAELGRETRDERQAALDALREQQADMAAALAYMRSGANEAWVDVRDGFVAAYDDLAASWDDATEAEAREND